MSWSFFLSLKYSASANAFSRAWLADRGVSLCCCRVVDQQPRNLLLAMCGEVGELCECVANLRKTGIHLMMLHRLSIHLRS